MSSVIDNDSPFNFSKYYYTKVEAQASGCEGMDAYMTSRVIYAHAMCGHMVDIGRMGYDYGIEVQ